MKKEKSFLQYKKTNYHFYFKKLARTLIMVYFL